SDIVQCARIADNAPNCGIRKPSSPSSRETLSVYEVLQLLIISDLLNDFPSESEHRLNLFPRPIVETVFLYFTVILLVWLLLIINTYKFYCHMLLFLIFK